MLDFMPDHIKTVGKILVGTLAILAGVLVFATVIGGLFFNLGFAQILGWFWTVLIVVFAIGSIYMIVTWIGSFFIWFLGPSFILPIFLVALAVILLAAYVLLKLLGAPVVFDLESILDPILSFIK